MSVGRVRVEVFNLDISHCIIIDVIQIIAILLQIDSSGCQAASNYY